MGYGVPDSGVDFNFVRVTDAYLLMKNDLATFVDSRDEENFQVSRLQTSFHLSANSLMMAGQVDRSLVDHLIALTHQGRTVICVSDACVPGIKNRGHVSRCRHIAQYLVELGADRARILRMAGGMNAWKRLQLDGVLGDVRRMWAGAPMGDDSAQPSKEEQEAFEEEPEPQGAQGSGAGWPEPEEDGTVQVLAGGDATNGERLHASVKPYPPRPLVFDTPTAYRVLKGEVFKKSTADSQKIIKITRPVSAIMRTTGEIWVGANGGRWAELDVEAGEKKGWIYLEGPGFGPTTCKIRTEFFKA